MTAYGEDARGGLRIAHGQVRAIVNCAGCDAPAYFTFSNDGRGAGDAGPGFSGGPRVWMTSGRLLVGIIFGYKDEASGRVALCLMTWRGFGPSFPPSKSTAQAGGN